SNLPIYQRIQRYDDYSGNNLNNLPTDFSIAQDNLKRNLATPHSLPYYEVTKLSGEKVKINPLNEKDINRLKDIALENAKNSANSFAIEDYFSNDGKTYRNTDNFSNLKDNVSKFINDNLITFLKKIKFSPSISTHTDFDPTTWKNDLNDFQKKEFYNLVSFNNNYSFYINGKKINKKLVNNSYVNKIKGEIKDLFSSSKDILKISEDAKNADILFDTFSTRDNLWNNLNWDDSKNTVNYAFVDWHAGYDLSSGKNKDFDEILQSFFGYLNPKENFKFELKNDTGICFKRLVAAYKDGEYTFYKILEPAEEITENEWAIFDDWKHEYGPSGTRYYLRFILDNYSRQVYFKFQNTLYFESSNSNLKEIKSDNDIKDYLFEHMGISKNNYINENNEIYKGFMNDFLTSYFGVNQSYKINNLKNLTEYNSVLTSIKNRYIETANALQTEVFSQLNAYGDKGISNLRKSENSHYFASDYSDATSIKNLTGDFVDNLNSKETNGDQVDKQLEEWKKKKNKIITFNEKPLF
ncbi:MAG: hypothetical protein K2J98_01830, partial [Malacoplasma sp.]|nr:hypothetical protein [Malacoplasma sp.]